MNISLTYISGYYLLTAAVSLLLATCATANIISCTGFGRFHNVSPGSSSAKCGYYQQLPCRLFWFNISHNINKDVTLPLSSWEPVTSTSEWRLDQFNFLVPAGTLLRRTDFRSINGSHEMKIRPQNNFNRLFSLLMMPIFLFHRQFRFLVTNINSASCITKMYSLKSRSFLVIISFL